MRLFGFPSASTVPDMRSNLSATRRQAVVPGTQGPSSAMVDWMYSMETERWKVRV